MTGVEVQPNNVCGHDYTFTQHIHLGRDFQKLADTRLAGHSDTVNSDGRGGKFANILAILSRQLVSDRHEMQPQVDDSRANVLFMGIRRAAE